mmetsp:Transcript_25466/g.19212  ORF Transcript_25466/g.19212 Transcript_25466/m.19212 type:complete len:80 (-) Transcript_25466:665-904(-)
MLLMASRENRKQHQQVLPIKEYWSRKKMRNALSAIRETMKKMIKLYFAVTATCLFTKIATVSISCLRAIGFATTATSSA